MKCGIGGGLVMSWDIIYGIYRNYSVMCAMSWDFIYRIYRI
jgi:hypothetical protein